MYKKINIRDLRNSAQFYEGTDVFNSEYIKELRSREILKYRITRNEKRPDLIARDIYGSVEYDWLVKLLNPLRDSDFVEGKIINYIKL